MNPNPPRPTTVAALIINWNGASDTIELLHSLEATCPAEVELSAAIIDNASAAADRQALEQFVAAWKGRMTLHCRANSHNIGVPAAYNQAIQILGTDYDFYLRLDNDVTLGKTGLASLIEAMRAQTIDRIGIAGGNVKYYDRPEIDNGGAVSIDLIKGKTAVRYPTHDTACDGVLGCIMLVDGELVRSLSPDVFDPRLFLCTDESELSLKARTQGWATWYVADTIGFHKSGRSTGKVSYISNYYSARNWAFLRFRYTSGFLNHAKIIVGQLMSLLKSMVRGRLAFILGTTSGLLLYLSDRIDRHARPKKSEARR